MDEEIEVPNVATYPDARLLIGMTFITGNGEHGKILGQVALYDFLVEWEDGRITLCSTNEMRGKSEPEIVEGKRSGRWLRQSGWVFSR